MSRSETMNNTKPRKVVDSKDLGRYKVNKVLLSVLNDWEEMCAYMRTGGREPPTEIRLFAKHYISIDELVRQQSDKKYGAADVRWKGHRLTR